MFTCFVYPSTSTSLCHGHLAHVVNTDILSGALIWQGFNLNSPQGQNTSPSPEILNIILDLPLLSADQSCAKMLQMRADCCLFGFYCGDYSTFLTFRPFAFCCTFRLFAALRLFDFSRFAVLFAALRLFFGCSRKIFVFLLLFAFRLFALRLAFATYPCPQPFANTVRTEGLSPEASSLPMVYQGARFLLSVMAAKDTS